MKKCHYCNKEFSPSKFDDGRQRFCCKLHQYKDWRRKHPERAKEIAKKTKDKHREKIREDGRRYYVLNKEKMKAYTLQWRQRNKARVVHQVVNRMKRIKVNGGSHTFEEWEEMKKRYNQKCAMCMKIKPLTRDHIIPVTKGGKNDISNIQPLCRQCNSRKFNHIDSDKEKVRHSE